MQSTKSCEKNQGSDSRNLTEATKGSYRVTVSTEVFSAYRAGLSPRGSYCYLLGEKTHIFIVREC